MPIPEIDLDAKPFYRPWRLTMHDINSPEPTVKEFISLPLAHTWAIQATSATTCRIELECVPPVDRAVPRPTTIVSLPADNLRTPPSREQIHAVAEEQS